MALQVYQIQPSCLDGLLLGDKLVKVEDKLVVVGSVVDVGEEFLMAFY